MKSEAKLTFIEAASIVVGHGVGAGILAVPYLASRNSIRETLLILLFSILYNIVLHLLIAELSLNNNGSQFVTCLDNELFSGRVKKALTWGAFILLGVSVVVNVSAYLTGAAAVFKSWFGWDEWIGILVFYILGSSVVFGGMKIVGFCEKISVEAMVGVVAVLFIASLTKTVNPLPKDPAGVNNALALFGVVSFSLSAVMSTPLVVKGLEGNPQKIKGAIITGILVNASLILVITLTTLIGAGKNITKDGALVDLAKSIGGWVSIIGYIFSLFALATSFWSNALNLRDIVNEQTSWGVKPAWATATLPPLIVAFLGLASFVGLTRFASVIQVVTGLSIIVAYHNSRKRVGESRLLGKYGTLGFQIVVAICSLLATVGAVLPVK